MLKIFHLMVQRLRQNAWVMIRCIYRKRPLDQWREFCDVCYGGSQKSPWHVLNFISLKFKENVNISLLHAGFYILLWHNKEGGPEIKAQRCPGPPSTPPLPGVCIPGSFRFSFCFALAGKWLAGLKEIYSCIYTKLRELVGSPYFMTKTW